MAMFCTFLLLLLYSSLMVQGENVIKIFREKAHPDDDILLERNSAECPKTGAAYTPACDTFNGASLGGCWCHCGRPNEKRTFFEPNNECVAVSTARQQSGCDLLITDETYDGPLEFFPLPGATATEKTVNVPENRTCSVYFNESLYVQYLACDGTWQQVPSQQALANFEVTPGWSSSSLVIRSKPGSTVLANNKGRIFRVAIQCRSQHESNVPANSSTCAMFKVQGSTFCPFPRPTPQTGGISVSLPPPISGTIIPATGTLRPLLTVKEKTTMQTPSKATEEPATKTTERPETTESGNSEVTENPGVLGDTGATKTSKKNTFIIAGAVAGGVLLMALVLLILWRCNNPKKRGHQHSRLEGSISSPISQMSRHSIPVYTDAAQFSHMGAMGAYGMRTSSMDNPTYRRGSDGIILGPDFKRGSLYPEVYPTSAPPRPPGVKRSSINGHVNPGLTLREEIVTMNPLFEGQVIEHKDLDPLNCSEFGLYPDQIVMEDRKNPAAFNETTYDCPEEILKGKPMTSTPVPVYYVVDDPYPDSISNTFGYDRGRPDGHVFDEPEGDLGRRPYVVMDNPNAVAYTLDYDGLPREGQLGARRQSSPNHGILKAGSMSPTNQRYPSQSDYDDGHTQVI